MLNEGREIRVYTLKKFLGRGGFGEVRLAARGKVFADYDKAVELEPDYFELYYYRGIAFIRKGDYGQALADYNKAIELKPEFAEAYKRRADLFLTIKEKEKAEADIQTYKDLSEKL
ncbi:MAG: tetratricopeptide repeat protein [Pyrinomonadaceae bacterium]